MSGPWRLALLSGAAAITLAGSARAAEVDDAQLAAMQARLDAMQAEIGALRSQVADLEASQSAPAAPAVAANPSPASRAPKPPASAGQIAWSSADGNLTGVLHAVMQLDTAQYFQDDDLPASVTQGRDLNSGGNFRRARLGVDGRLFQTLDYGLLLEFGGSGTDGDGTMHELWLQYSDLKPFKLRVGAFAPNVGLEDAKSTSAYLFPERPSASEVSRSLAGSDKRIAAQVLANGEQWLAAAAVTGGKLFDVATADEQIGYTARLAATPLHGEDWLVHVGANASLVTRPGQPSAGAAHSITYQDRPELRVDGASLVSTGAIDAEGAGHWGLELAGQWRGLLVEAEYFDFQIRRRDPAPGLTDPDFSGWYVQGGWMLTGEQRRYNAGAAAFGAAPIEAPFDPAGGGWGALELATRYSVLDLNHAPFSALAADRVRGGEQTVATVGLNWFLNPAVRFSLDYLDVEIDRRNADGSQAGQSFEAINLRSQFAF